MKLLGEWNWYLPRWLEWLPRFEPGESPAVPEGAAGSSLTVVITRDPGRGSPLPGSDPTGGVGFHRRFPRRHCTRCLLR
jgi:hypothetical protein